MEIPPEAAIKATIKPGSVFYFPEETLSSIEPHYFIVINVNPLTDHELILACASSQIQKTKRRRKYYPPETVVEITSSEYKDFPTNSVIDCNRVILKTLEQVIQKRSESKLILKERMETSLVNKLRQGVLTSPRVENKIKALLRE